MLRLLFLTGIFLALSGFSNNSEKTHLPTQLNQEIKDAYENGQAILLYYVDPKDNRTETYSDWFAYFEEFKAAEGTDFYIQAIDHQELTRLVSGSESVEEFSLFIKAGYPSFLHPDIILEPQVYGAVANIYSGNVVSDMDRAFMPGEVRLLEKEIKGRPRGGEPPLDIPLRLYINIGIIITSGLLHSGIRVIS